MERLDLSQYKLNHVNITGFRLVDPTASAVKDYTKKWDFAGSNWGMEHPLYVSTRMPWKGSLYPIKLKELFQTWAIKRMV